MNLLEAHARLAEIGEESRDCVPVVVELEGPGGFCDGWPLVATALASLSGQLEDATTDEDLTEAAAHGFSLLNCGVLAARAVDEEAAAVYEAVMKWGDELTEEPCSTG